MADENEKINTNGKKRDGKKRDGKKRQSQESSVTMEDDHESDLSDESVGTINATVAAYKNNDNEPLDEEQKVSMINELNTILTEAKVMKKQVLDNQQESKIMETQMKLEKAKIEFQNYVQDKLDKISIRANIIRFKYSGYKQCFDCINILIIIASATLTLVEAIKAEFELEDTEYSGSNTFFTSFPLIVSSAITVIAAVMKFKKYQEKMESLSRCIEKAIFTTYRLKRIQEQTRHATDLDTITKLIQSYSGEPYDLYLKCQEEMEKCLKYEDLVKHMKTYFDLSLEYQQEESNYRLSRMSIGLHQSKLKQDLKDKIESSTWVKTWGDTLSFLFCCCCCCNERTNKNVLRRFMSFHKRKKNNVDIEMVETKI